jgi:putative Ca2+/H+ antiporter (TMEM165/GDT1 family)
MTGIVAVIFAAFGFHALLNQNNGDSEEVVEKRGHGVFFTTLLLILVAEFGDKTQIAVAGLAGSMASIPVWVGATVALVMVSALGVWAGRTVLQRLPLHWLHRAGGAVFLIFAAMAAWRALAL